MLVIAMALSLPIDEVAKAADVMFLFMFAQVNVTLMTLRRRRPDLDRGYNVPFFPWPALIGVVTNVALALFLAIETGRIGLLTVAWIAGGMMLYWGYFRGKEKMEQPSDIIHEEAIATVKYSVLAPVANVNQADALGKLASLLARAHNGEVLALNVVTVPPTFSLSDGRMFLEEGRAPMDKVIQQAKQMDVPVHTMIRLGRSVSQAIVKTVAETASDFVLFGWPGTSGSHGRLFGSVIDYVVANPPTDMGIVRVRPFDKLERILVPVAGGPNGRLALSVATALASQTSESSRVILLHVMPGGGDARTAQARAASVFRSARNGNTFPAVEEQILEAETPLAGILQAAKACDILVIGATKEPLFRNLLMGNVAQQVTEQVSVPVIVVKKRSRILSAILRETVLPPIHRSPKMPQESAE